MKKQINIQPNIPKEIWKEFYKLYYDRDQNRNEALTEAFELWNEKNKERQPVKTEEPELIKTSARIIMKVWEEFKKLRKLIKLKQDEATVEAIQLYIDKYRGE